MLARVATDADVAIGSRYVAAGAVDESWGFRRRQLSLWGNRMARWIAGLKGVPDCTAGFKAIRTSALREARVAEISVLGYAFQVALLHRLLHSGARVVEEPIYFRDRQRGVTIRIASSKIHSKRYRHDWGGGQRRWGSPWSGGGAGQRSVTPGLLPEPFPETACDSGTGQPMTGADGEHLPVPAKRDPWLALADFLAKEAETLKTDPGFAAEVCSAAYRLAIPLPAAVVSDRTCSAVARRCSDLIASGQPAPSRRARPPMRHCFANSTMSNHRPAAASKIARIGAQAASLRHAGRWRPKSTDRPQGAPIAVWRAPAFMRLSRADRPRSIRRCALPPGGNATALSDRSCAGCRRHRHGLTASGWTHPPCW